MARITSPMCLKCGTIEKSARSSCCGRGGSWFRKCGGSPNTKFDHSWYDGRKACEAWAHFKSAAGQYLEAGQPKGTKSNNGDGTIKFKLRITDAKTPITTSANASVDTPSRIAKTNTPTDMLLMNAQVPSFSNSMTITTQECETFFKTTFLTSIFLMIAC